MNYKASSFPVPNFFLKKVEQKHTKIAHVLLILCNNDCSWPQLPSAVSCTLLLTTLLGMAIGIAIMPSYISIKGKSR